MKSTAMFLGIVFGLSFLASGAMLFTATLKPEWFMLGTGHAQADALHSSRAKKDAASAAAAPALRDSAAADSAPADSASAPSAQPSPQAALAADTAAASLHTADTAASLHAGVHAPETSARTSAQTSARTSAQTSAVPRASHAAQPSSADSSAATKEDLHTLVKLYDAMKPDAAAKILSKQPNKDVRTIILHIKKKQAAKILSLFNADRAAQILAQ